MVGESGSDGTIPWRQWQKVPDLDTVAKDCYCYQLDSTQGIINFGDNEHGRIPIKGINNIIMTDCTVTEAGAGNINVGKITGFLEYDNEFQGITVQQISAATGGKGAEDIAAAELRLRKDMKACHRAVTIEDFENIVLNAPGLMIKNVKVLPLYKPGLEGYPQNKEENCMTLVVEPFCEDEQGHLSKGYIKNLKKHVEKYRLLTTKVYIMEPQYIGWKFGK